MVNDNTLGDNTIATGLGSIGAAYVQVEPERSFETDTEHYCLKSVESTMVIKRSDAEAEWFLENESTKSLIGPIQHCPLCGKNLYPNSWTAATT